ncbi:MAG: DUF1778 domain-containing protein [Solirubrobacteraceae bacterium]
MAVTKAERIEARLTATQRREIELAAGMAGESVSAFMVAAALDRAGDLVGTHATTVVPADYFDALAAALDRPDDAPGLRRAVDEARRHGRIAPA